MKEVNGKGSTLVADVDCMAVGKPLCDSNGVQGSPRSHGDRALLRITRAADYDSLKKSPTAPNRRALRPTLTLRRGADR